MYEIYIRPLIAGLLMGIVSTIPGADSGTISVITGVFKRLVDALNDLGKLKLKRTDVLFLIIVGIGLLGGLVIGSNVLVWAFENQPFYTYSFFFGLILFALFTLKNEIESFRIIEFLCGLLLVVIPYMIVKPSSMGVADPTHVNYIFLFISGIIAGATMILPGVSGALILTILGFYNGAIQAIGRITKQPALSDVAYLLVLGVGAVIGLFIIARLIEMWFERAKESIMNFIIGLVVGSLYQMTPSFHGSGNTGLMLVWFAIGALFIMIINIGGARSNA